MLFHYGILSKYLFGWGKHAFMLDFVACRDLIIFWWKKKRLMFGWCHQLMCFLAHVL